MQTGDCSTTSNVISPPDQGGIATTYFGFIDSFGQRIREGKSGEAPTSTLLSALPGLSELLSSFPVASLTERQVIHRKVEDWNPLGQRLLLPDSLPAPASAFETEFSLLTMSAQTLVEWAHEAIHVLAVEHWTTGQVSLADEAEFSQWYLASEGLAFWYADIVVTRAIRQAVPTAELIYTRSAVSNAGFHPEEAFRSMGLQDTDPLCDLYIACFLDKTDALTSSSAPLARTYGKRLHDFYCESGKTLSALWNVLHDQGFLTGYWERFCAIPGLPSLLDPTTGGSIAAQIAAIGRRGLPGLAGLAPHTVKHVSLRRSAQVRAWHGWSLRWMLQNDWVFGLSTVDTASLLSALEIWLDKIEMALRALPQGDAETACRILEEADGEYARTIQMPLTEAGAGSRYRYWVFPYFAPTGGLIGLWDNRTGYTPDEARKVLQFVAEKAGWSASVVRAQAVALEALEQIDASPEIARARFNDAMLTPEMRAVWSIPIWQISPEQDFYRELVFEFH